MDQFIATFHRFCGDDQTFFVATMTSRPIGLETAFSIQLADKQPVLRGMCIVLDAWETPDNRYKRPGIRLGIKRLTADSQPVFERLKAAARSPALVEGTPAPGPPPGPLPAMPSAFGRSTPSPLPSLIVPRTGGMRATTATPPGALRPPAVAFTRQGLEFDLPAHPPAPPAERKPIDVKPIEARPAGARPADANPIVAKPVEAKPFDAKPADAKPIDARPVAATPDAKPADVRPVVELTPVSTRFSATRPGFAPRSIAEKPADAKPVDAKPVDAKPLDVRPVDARPVLAANAFEIKPAVEPRLLGVPSLRAKPGSVRPVPTKLAETAATPVVTRTALEANPPALPIEATLDRALPAPAITPDEKPEELAREHAVAADPAPIEVTRFQVALNVDAAPPPVDDVEFKPMQLMPRPRVEPRVAGDPASDEATVDPATPALIVDRPSHPEQPEAHERALGTTAAEHAARASDPTPAGMRAPGSALVLPANPLHNLSDESLEGFVDCTLYEESGNIFHPVGSGEWSNDLDDPPAPPPARAGSSSATVPAMPFDVAPDLTVRSLGNTESLALEPDEPASSATHGELDASGPPPLQPSFAPAYEADRTSTPAWLDGPNAPYASMSPAARHDPSHAGPHDPRYTAPYDPRYIAPHDPSHAGPYDPRYVAPHDPSHAGPHDPRYVASHYPSHPAPHDSRYPTQHDASHAAPHDVRDAVYPSDSPMPSQYATPASMALAAPGRSLVGWQRWGVIIGTAVVAIFVAFAIAKLVRGSPPATPVAASRGADGPSPGAAAQPPPRAQAGSTGSTGPATTAATTAFDRKANAAAQSPTTAAKPAVDVARPEDDDAVAGGTPIVGSGPCRLTVATTPAGSVIRLDNVAVGPSPLTISSTCEKHRIEVSHARYQSLTRWVTLASDKAQELDVTLQRPIHAVTVTSFPPGAELSIDGRRAGTTPTVVRMMGFATVKLTFTKPGFQSVTKKIYSKVPQERVFVKLMK